MSRIILLDSGPLGLITNPKATPENRACKNWLDTLLANKCRVIIPGIIDYEIRRELIRAGKQSGLRRLDEFCRALEFLDIRQAALFKAADLWALARKQGRQTADDHSLDADVILCAQTLLLNDTDAVIATTNSRHLSQFARAEIWDKIAA